MLLVLLALGGQAAAAGDAKKGGIKGRIRGGDALLNPVWTEASAQKSHRYYFRTKSTSVGERAQHLTAYLPKELCIAALKKDGSGAPTTPPLMTVSGGRTTPVTLVVGEGQAIQLSNADPFDHQLYDTSGGGLGPEEQKPGATRSFKPGKPGSYEIRDKLFPSVRSWVVVEPRVAQIAYPTLGGEFTLRDVPPGNYELTGYFMGKPTGKALEVELKGDELDLKDPLIVGEDKK